MGGSPPRPQPPDLRSRPRPGRSPRAGALGVFAASAIVLILTVPTTAATYRIEVTPPFAGVAPIAASSANTDGCHTAARFVVPASANLSTGRVRSDGISSASGCGGAPYPQYAVTGDDLGFQGPNFTVPVSGTYTISFVWRLSFAVSLSASGDASDYAQASLFTLEALFVPSNQSSLYVDASNVLFVRIHSGTYANSTEDLVVGLSGKVSLVAGLVYQFLTVLIVETTSWLVGPGVESAAFDFAHGGDGGRLRSMALTG